MVQRLWPLPHFPFMSVSLQSDMVLTVPPELYSWKSPVAHIAKFCGNFLLEAFDTISHVLAMFPWYLRISSHLSAHFFSYFFLGFSSACFLKLCISQDTSHPTIVWAAHPVPQILLIRFRHAPDGSVQPDPTPQHQIHLSGSLDCSSSLRGATGTPSSVSPKLDLLFSPDPRKLLLMGPCMEGH